MQHFIAAKSTTAEQLGSDLGLSQDQELTSRVSRYTRGWSTVSKTTSCRGGMPSILQMSAESCGCTQTTDDPALKQPHHLDNSNLWLESGICYICTVKEAGGHQRLRQHGAAESSSCAGKPAAGRSQGIVEARAVPQTAVRQALTGQS